MGQSLRVEGHSLYYLSLYTAIEEMDWNAYN